MPKAQTRILNLQVSSLVLLTTIPHKLIQMGGQNTHFKWDVVDFEFGVAVSIVLEVVQP